MWVIMLCEKSINKIPSDQASIPGPSKNDSTFLFVLTLIHL